MKFNLNHKLLFYAVYQTPCYYLLLFFNFYSSSLEQYPLLTHSFKVWADLT